MNMAPPEPGSEYSRGSGASGGPPGASSAAASGARLPAGILAAAVLGALIMIVAELTPLFTVREQSTNNLIRTVSTGSHNDYALVLIGLLAVAMAAAFWRLGSRPALLAVGVLGVGALLVALVHDLPDAHASGLIRHASGVYLNAAAVPSTGFYLETLGAVVLLATCAGAFTLLGPPRPSPRTGPGERR